MMMISDVFGQGCAYCTGNRVSIGASFTPQSVLHVDTAARIGRSGNNSGELIFTNVAGNDFTIATPSGMTTQKYLLPINFPTGANDQLVSNTSGQMSWVAPGTVSNAWLTTGNGGTVSTTNFLGTTDAVDLVIRTTNTERIWVKSGGNVGIGTSSPDGILHMRTTGNTDLILERGTSSTQDRLVFHDEGGIEQAYMAYDANENIMVKNLDQDEDIIFNINDGGTDTEAMRIEGNSADVGIGTSSPSGRLHVMATATGTQEKVARFGVVGATGGQEIQILNRSTIATEYAPWIECGTNTASNSGLYLSARIQDAGNSGSVPATEKLVVSSIKN